MLVATPGQTASYPLHSSNNNSNSSSAPTKTCHTSSTAPPPQKIVTSNGNANAAANNCNSSSSLNVHAVARPVVSKLAESSSALMKTLSVRLNRGTEFLKGTVQKALISSANSASNSSSSTSGNNAAASNFKHIYQNRANNTTVATAAATAVTTNFPVATTKHNSSGTAAAAAAALNCNRTSTAASTTVAVSLAAKKAASASATSSNTTLYTVPPTAIHRYPEERQHTTSTDSLHKEMCHFKPIRPVPTTLWKCSSKSRGGAVLKRPKASLATKLNYNCDDPTAKYGNCAEKMSTAASTHVNADAVAAELHSYQFYKPKPSSTLLTTIITTPAHQSAFVCLVAQMKNLVNIQTTKQSNSKTGKMLELYKTRSGRGRGRTKATAAACATAAAAAAAFPTQQLKKSPSINVPLTQLFLRSRKQPFVQVKKINLPTELIIKKRIRGTRAKGVSKAASTTSGVGKKVKNAKSTGCKPKLKETKSKMIDIVSFAQENSMKNSNKSNVDGIAADECSGVTLPDTKRKQRKRKYVAAKIEDETNYDDSDGGVGGGGAGGDADAVSGSESGLVPSPRKSARLSKGYSSEVLHITSVKKITLRKRKSRGVTKRVVECFSPPLTRSRLKQMMQRSLSTTLDNSTRQRVA